MENTNKTLGQLGEDTACSYLRDKGFRILFRNYRKPWGEIDIVAQARDMTLVFVEVKTLRRGSGQAELNNENLTPEDEMSAAKIKKFKLICETFVSHNPRLVNERRGWRMDVLAIDADQNKKPNEWKVRHYENI